MASLDKLHNAAMKENSKFNGLMQEFAGYTASGKKDRKHLERLRIGLHEQLDDMLDSVRLLHERS